MAILNHVNKHEYTHYGWLGLCPIYVNMSDPDSPGVCCRNGWPEWWLDLNSSIQGLFMFVLLQIFGTEPMFALKLTGEIQQCSGS